MKMTTTLLRMAASMLVVSLYMRKVMQSILVKTLGFKNHWGLSLYCLTQCTWEQCVV